MRVAADWMWRGALEARLECLDEAMSVLEAVVERHRGDAHHIGLAPVAGDTGGRDAFEQPSAIGGLDAQRELAAAPGALARCQWAGPASLSGTGRP